MKKTIIVRIRGGLGNQLFCYAAARRLAIVNGAELVIDDVSGFARDFKFQRAYALDNFNIPARRAAPHERMAPFERARRAWAKWKARRQPFGERDYVEQEQRDFDARLLSLRVAGAQRLYLDGLWQSEGYFKDVEATIRRELTFRAPTDSVNQDMASRIAVCRDSVALHVRWFDPPHEGNLAHNLSGGYYARAVGFVRAHCENPHFFLFSDDPKAAVQHLSLPAASCTLVCHNVRDETAYADMWLMSQCHHFITANSTFSWWGAWLSPHRDKLVITPDPELLDAKNAWRVGGLIPDEWTRT